MECVRTKARPALYHGEEEPAVRERWWFRPAAALAIERPPRPAHPPQHIAAARVRR